MPGPSGNQFEIYNGYVISVGHNSILAWSLDDVGKPTHPGYPAIGRLEGLAELRGVMLTISKLHGLPL